MVKIDHYYCSDYDTEDYELMEKAYKEQDLDTYIRLRQLVLLREIRDKLEEME